MNQIIKSKKGFTLVELIIVMAMIGVLAAVLIPSMVGYIDKANMNANYQEAMTVKKVVDTAILEQASITVDLIPSGTEERTFVQYSDFNDVKLSTFVTKAAGMSLPAGASCSITDDEMTYTNRNISIIINLTDNSYTKNVL